MGYSILIKKFGHFRCDHVLIVGDRNERNFLAGLRLRFSGRKRCLRGFWIWCVAHHKVSIHETVLPMAIQMLPARKAQETGFGRLCR